MSDDENTVRRIMPQSGLDFNMMLTNTVWGSPQISEQMNARVSHRMRVLKDPQNVQEEDDKTASYDLLSFYTRDMRLANLDHSELTYVNHYIDLAHDLLNDGFVESFSTALSRSATVMETSQSKNGFLRRRQNTLTTESMTGEIEPKKKKLLSYGKNGGG